MTEEVAAAAGEAEGVGAELTRAREALGLSIADVARQLKFAPRQIEALEQERFDRLPAGTFVRGMLRAYARMLKLDSDAVVGRVAARLAAPDNTAAVASVHRAIPITDSARRGNLTYVALSVALLVVIAAVTLEWQQERARAARLSFVPAAQAPIAPEPRRGPVASAAASSVVTPQQVVPMSEGESGAKPAAQSNPAQPSQQPVAEGSRRLVLRFERESWVEVRGRGGRLLLSQLNPAGSERQLDGEPPFQLIIGNAQHVRLTYGDRPVDLAPHVKVEVARLTLE